MKRARDAQGFHSAQGTDQHSAFACSLRPNGSALCFSVQLPEDVVAGTPVFAELSSLEGGAELQQRPECLLAWLAWHAYRHSRAQADATPGAFWDAEVDAFNVRVL